MSTVLLNGILHDIDWDEDGGHWKVKPPPLCPACGESLGSNCDDETTKVSVHTEWIDDQHVECDNCGETYPIDGVLSLKSRRQADGFS